RTAAWRRFMLATRKADVQSDGVRGRLIGTPAAREVELETSLTIVNRERTPMSGAVRFGALPEGWSARSEEAVVSPIAPGSARRVTLSARASHVPTGEGRILGLPIELATDDGEVHRRTVRVASLTALPTESAIRIDGDLSDWPPGSVNVAADFRLIAGSREDGDQNILSRPTEKTFGFVLRDRDYLYIAVNCERDARVEGPSARRKGVRYDDLIPVEEEDLIEVLIDPLNGGTRSPGDLYHIVVKRSGTDLTEKGIGFDPPCGPREPWAVDIEVATAASSQRWTAELRIPFRTIISEGYDQTVWGFNLTRWDAARQEFSTWSGAVGNAYDPLSLGNLFLP
ncbi:MAG: sugar-binding protein, partial [Planctomycetota bacterium]